MNCVFLFWAHCEPQSLCHFESKFLLFQELCVLPVSLQLELEHLTVTVLDCICDYFLELTGKTLMLLKLRPRLSLMFSWTSGLGGYNELMWKIFGGICHSDSVSLGQKLPHGDLGHTNSLKYGLCFEQETFDYPVRAQRWSSWTKSLWMWHYGISAKDFGDAGFASGVVLGLLCGLGQGTSSPQPWDPLCNEDKDSPLK